MSAPQRKLFGLLRAALFITGLSGTILSGHHGNLAGVITGALLAACAFVP